MTSPIRSAPLADWVEIGGLDDFRPRAARIVRTPSGDVAVFRTESDEFFALDNRCPHRGGPLSEGIVYGDAVACPLHSWVISLRTGLAQWPDEGCVRTIPVRTGDGRVFLALAGLRDPA